MKKLISNAMVFFALAFAACSQNYSISRYQIAGGGGGGSGGIFSVNATIGQPISGGTMSGGNYSVSGGFWNLFAVQSPGVPTLRLFLAATNIAVVAWPTTSAGYTLQSTTNLATANWSSVINATNIVGSENQVVITPVSGNRYFRLKNP